MPASTVLAIAAVTALLLVLLAPLALAGRSTRAAAPVAGCYALMLTGLLTWYSGALAKSEISPAMVKEVETTEITDAQCREVFRLLDRAQAIIDRSTPPLLVVSGKAWRALPESAQGAIIGCVERSWPDNSDPVQVEER